MTKEENKVKEEKTGIIYDPFSNSYCLIPNELQELYEEYDKLQKLIDRTLEYSEEQIRILSLYK